MASTLLKLRDVLVRYGETVALELDRLDVYAGEVLAIIGPNGSGKSTLLRMMGLLQRPTSGTVLLHDENALTGNTLQIRRRIATVFQEPLLLNATVHENAALGLKLRGVDRREVARRLEPWLERLGIAHLRGRSARSLSGGEAQRTSIARALVLEPEILLLDEPFAALDPASREALLQDFHSILKESAITAVFVTHDREEAFGLAGRIGVLRQGRLAQVGAREDVFRRPVSDDIAEIVGVENRLPGVVEDCGNGLTGIRVNHNRFKIVGQYRPGAQVLVCLRPEDIVIGCENSTTSDCNRLTGMITRLSTGVMHQRITMDCEGMQVVSLMDRKAFCGLELAEGKKATATFNSSAAHIIVNT